MRVPKTVRNTFLTVIILVVLFVAAGVIYVLISGGNTTKPKTSTPNTTQELTIPKPHKSAANAPESAALESIVSPVSPGSNTSMSIRTQPGSACDISVAYNNVPSKDSGLVTKTADEYGGITWSWTVDKTASTGTWPVKVNCIWNKKTAFLEANLQVSK